MPKKLRHHSKTRKHSRRHRKHHSHKRYLRTHNLRLRMPSVMRTMKNVRRFMGMRGGFNETVPYLPPNGPYVAGADPITAVNQRYYYGLNTDLAAPNGSIIDNNAHLTTPGITKIQTGGSGLLPELKPAPLDASMPDFYAAIEAGQKAVAAVESAVSTNN